MLLVLSTFCYIYVGGSFFSLFFAVAKVTVMKGDSYESSIAIMQLEVFATLWQVKISAAYMCVTIFIEIMQVGVSVAIMQVVFSIVHCAHDYFYCNYAVIAIVCDSFK